MNASNDTAMFASTGTPPPALGSPFIDRLADLEAACWVDVHSLPAFLAEPGEALLFVWTQPARYPECTDVAVVLPELRKAVSGQGGPRFRIGVVAAESENEIADQYGVMRRPSLVVLRNGEYLATIAGMLDWDVFLSQLREALQAPATRPLRILR